MDFMRIITVHVDLVFSGEADFVGSLTISRRTPRDGWVTRYKKGPYYGRILPSGSYQLYEMGHGTMTKVATVKAHQVDFSRAILKDSLPLPEGV